MRTLSQAGWHPGRRIDLSTVRAAMTARGIELSAAAESFLSEFGLLTLAVTIRDDPSLVGHVYVDPRQACGEASWLRFLSELAGDMACPLAGSSYRLELYVTSGGRCFSVDEDGGTFAWLGTIDETIEAVCDGRFFTSGGYVIEGERLGRAFAPGEKWWERP